MWDLTALISLIVTQVSDIKEFSDFQENLLLYIHNDFASWSTKPAKSGLSLGSNMEPASPSFIATLLSGQELECLSRLLFSHKRWSCVLKNKAGHVGPYHELGRILGKPLNYDSVKIKLKSLLDIYPFLVHHKFSWFRLNPLCDQLSNSQSRFSQRLRVSAAVPVHVVAVGGPVDEDGRGLGWDVLQDAHRVPWVDCSVDKYDIVNIRVVTSVSEVFN